MQGVTSESASEPCATGAIAAATAVPKTSASGIRVCASGRQVQRNGRVGALPLQGSGTSDATTRAASLERTVLMAALARGERGVLRERRKGVFPAGNRARCARCRTGLPAAPAHERPCTHTNS